MARSIQNGQSSLKTNRYGKRVPRQAGMKYPMPPISPIETGSDQSFGMLSTTSLVESFTDYPMENGRQYASLDPDAYFMPNDELEQDRLNLMHQIYLSLLSSRLTIVPIPPNVTHILDIGTGTGEWAINMAETYQSAEIIGTDISAIQPKAVPSNVYFEIDDAQLDWEFSHQFDFIHIRGLAGAFDDWSTVYAQAFKFLKPGGYIEIIDHGPSVVPGLLQSPTVVALREAFQVACAVSGRPFNTDHLNPSILEAVGFTEVTTVENKMLLGGNVPPTDGSNDWKQKFGLVSFLESVESSVLRPLTRTAGWAVEDVKEAIETSKQQLAVLANQPEGGYTPVYFVVAKKPL